jgi:hypothetical protein
MEWTDSEVHSDDDMWPDGQTIGSAAKAIDIKPEDDAVEFLVPPRTRR